MRKKKKFLNVLLALSVTLAFSLFLDGVLGILGYPSSFPVANPKSFKEHRKNIEFEYVFETNSQGLRYKELPFEKPKGNSRIFVVGDSFTEGVGVDDDEVFVSLIEKDFTEDGLNVNFINGGLRGQGPLQYGRIFFHLGVKYQPNGLLICLYANDVTDTPESINLADFQLRPRLSSFSEKLFYAFYPRTYIMAKKLMAPRYQKSHFVQQVSEQALKLGKTIEEIEAWRAKLPEDLLAAVKRNEFTGAYLSYGLTKPHYWSDALDIDTKRAERKWQSMVFALEEIVEQAQQLGVEVAVVYFPGVFQYASSAYSPSNPRFNSGITYRKHWLTEQTEVQKRIQAFCRRMQVSFLDLTNVFRKAFKENDNLNWKLDVHWRPEGHRVAATAITKWIKERRVFSSIVSTATSPNRNEE